MTTVAADPDTAFDPDQMFMARCVELAAEAIAAGETPFACLIARNGEIIVEATNRTIRDGDITRHAEMVAISEAQKILGRGRLKGCTLYTTVEPCPMCSFAVRESRISRVVFGLWSPLMGGVSRWDILADRDLSRRMGEVFGRPPRVRGGVMAREAGLAWRRWNPLAWVVIRWRGVFRLP
jgi:tRNA(adenine34) deaminase